MDKRYAAVYARLSQQGEDEESIARQVGLCTAYAIEHFGAVEVYVEPPGMRSGYYESKRPEWRRLKKDIGEGKVSGVVVAELSRASRKIEDTMAFVTLCVSKQVEFVSLKEKLDPHSAMGRAFIAFSAVINQLERDITSERKLVQFKARDKAIYAPNSSPLGMVRSGKYPNVSWSKTDKFPYVIEMLERYAEGWSYDSIARELRSRGIVWETKFGGLAPVEATVSHVVQKAERYGLFIDPGLLYRVQSERIRRAGGRANSRHAKHALPYLRQLVFCADCGVRYHTRHHKSILRSKPWSYYGHPNDRACPNLERVHCLNAADLHLEFWARFRWIGELGAEELDYLAEKIVELRGESKPTIDTDQQRDKLSQRLAGFERMLADGDISRARFLEVKREIEGELDTLPPIPIAVPVRRVLTVPEVRLQLGELFGLVRSHAETDPTATNQYLHLYIQQIRVRGKEITEIVYHSDWAFLATRPPTVSLEA